MKSVAFGNLRAFTQRAIDGVRSMAALRRTERVGAATDATGGRPLAYGALACSIYSILNLALNGVRLDEAVMPAQIIAGTVHYPAGHPHVLFNTQAISLLNFVAAGLWKIIRNAVVLSGVFSFLFLFTSLYAPFVVAFALTRRPAWSYAASAIAAFEVVRRLNGLYPMFVFPAYLSNGHIGTHAALITIALLLARQWRIGGLFLGLIPAMHGAMTFVVWPWAFLFMLFAEQRPRSNELRQFAMGTALGLAVFAGLVWLVHLQSATAVVAPPYDVPADGGLVYQGFSMHTDTHRRLFSPISFGYLINPVAFFALTVLLLLRSPRQRSAALPSRGAIAWVALFGVIGWVYVYGSWVARASGCALPSILNIVMPFRFSNLTALLLVPVSVAALAGSLRNGEDRLDRSAGVMVAVLIGAAALSLIDPAIVTRNLLFALWGAFFALELRSVWPRAKDVAPLLVAMLLVAGSLTVFIKSSRVVVYFLVIFTVFAGGAWLLNRLRPGEPAVFARGWLLPAASVLAAVVALPGQHADPDISSRRFTTFDSQLVAWLDQHRGPNAPILPPVSPWTYLQPKTGHPALFQWETLYLMAYMPNLAPVIGALARDFYGVDYADHARLTRMCGGWLQQRCPEWLDAWRGRTRAEWQAIGRKYDFDLVIAPADLKLDLPSALEGERWTLYEIPRI
jgi:hypothetical protein